jgi:hypothetical protein
LARLLFKKSPVHLGQRESVRHFSSYLQLGWTPLLVACAHSGEAVEFFLQNDARLTDTAGEYRPRLEFPADTNFVALVQDGRSCLQVAAGGTSVAALRLLLKRAQQEQPVVDLVSRVPMIARPRSCAAIVC